VAVPPATGLISYGLATEYDRAPAPGGCRRTRNTYG